MPSLSVPVVLRPFASTTWAAVEQINRTVCGVAGHEFGRAENYEAARELWEERHGMLLTFLLAADLCRECHRLAPFHFLNGNTFASCARVALSPMMAALNEVQQTFSRAALGHYIAGTISRDEMIAIVHPTLSF